MYLEHFGLNSAPFNITSQTDFFFDGAARGDTLAALVYAVQQGEGIVKVTGEVGSGKTMLCRMLLESLPENVETIFLSVPSLKRDEIMEALCIELGIRIEGQARYQLLTALQQKLVQLYANDRRLVALIDEAHAMPLESLEEIRLLTNLENGDHKLLQIILFGQPELDDHLRLTHMRQLKERITHSFHLGPLQKPDIDAYLAHRLNSAGYKGAPLFSPACVKLMTHASAGLTRRVNIIADKSLLAAYSQNTRTLTPEHIRAAIRDSDFPLPTDWGRRAGLGAVTLLAAAAIGLGLYKTVGITNTTNAKLETNTPALAAKPQQKARPSAATAEPTAESRPGAELIVGSPEWHEKNLNKNNKISNNTNEEVESSQAAQKSPNSDQNTVKSANSQDNSAKLMAAPEKIAPTPAKAEVVASANIGPDSDAVASPATAISDVANSAQKPLTSANVSKNEPISEQAEKKSSVDTGSVNVKAVQPAASNLQKHIASSKVWLDGQPASQCLIQLLITDMNNHVNVDFFLKTTQQQLGAQSVFVFPSEIKGQAKYTVIYANFAAAKDCEGALQKLPAPLKQSKPYIRSVELLRNEIKYPG